MENVMNFEIVLIAAAIHILFWEKMPEWGTLFMRVIDALPGPLRTLYYDWKCPYCAGFWIALVLHGLTGLWFLPVLAEMPAYLGVIGAPLAWVLDALAVAMLVLVMIISIKAVGLPAMKAHQMRDEFMQSMAKEEKR
ncbi:MAG: hypothetical protein ACJAZW_002920 [Maritalea sp.]|jgi:hypothetical protein